MDLLCFLAAGGIGCTEATSGLWTSQLIDAVPRRVPSAGMEKLKVGMEMANSWFDPPMVRVLRCQLQRPLRARCAPIRWPVISSPHSPPRVPRRRPWQRPGRRSAPAAAALSSLTRRDAATHAANHVSRVRRRGVPDRQRLVPHRDFRRVVRADSVTGVRDLVQLRLPAARARRHRQVHQLPLPVAGEAVRHGACAAPFSGSPRKSRCIQCCTVREPLVFGVRHLAEPSPRGARRARSRSLCSTSPTLTATSSSRATCWCAANGRC